ncbi:MAG TPA: glutamyl-tRNA reductase [Thermodesulfobacteriaceae bacterium]|nr:glutamyl-tRNA reductase [Thermodesulfobacteriaceae bacterium]
MQAGSSRSQIALLGVNHRTAPVEIRERLALSGCNLPALQVFSEIPSCEEVVFLSTCNRVELMIASRCLEESRRAVKDVWSSMGGVDASTFQQVIYEYEGEEAVRHLFRVASSLDSMIVGEPQILGQLKDAYRKAAEADSAGMVLNRLFHKAFSVAKRVRTETRIANSAVSISYAAVELAKKIFGEFEDRNAMLIGAGEMAELAAKHLVTNGVSRLVVANRTLSRAVELARQLGGKAISLDELEDALLYSDIVISSTGAPGIILGVDQVKRIMRPRRHRLLFFIDIAVPRDIDPGINEIDNVYLYGIDDLKGVVEVNKSEREREALKAGRIVDSEVIKFLVWMDSLEVVPVIQEVQRKAENIRRKELARSRKVLDSLDPKQQKAVDVLTKSMVQKILHDPIIFLRNEAGGTSGRELLDVANRLFGLNRLDAVDWRVHEEQGGDKERQG